MDVGFTAAGKLETKHCRNQTNYWLYFSVYDKNYNILVNNGQIEMMSKERTDPCPQTGKMSAFLEVVNVSSTGPDGEAKLPIV